MRIRSRAPVALIALLTLLVSTTETLWASMCAPEMSGAAVSTETSAPTAHQDPGCAGEHAGSVPAPDHQPGPGEQHCPLLALGTAGGCVPASLPSSAPIPADLGGDAQAWLPRADTQPLPLFGPPPFHPPKA
jgi:hypothetical protein